MIERKIEWMVGHGIEDHLRATFRSVVRECEMEEKLADFKYPEIYTYEKLRAIEKDECNENKCYFPNRDEEKR